MRHVGSVRSPRRAAVRVLGGSMPGRLCSSLDKHHIRRCGSSLRPHVPNTSLARLLSACGGTVGERRAVLRGERKRKTSKRMVKRYNRHKGHVSEEETRRSVNDDRRESHGCSVPEEEVFGSKREEVDTPGDLEYGGMEIHVRVLDLESNYRNAVEKLILEVENMKMETWDGKGSGCVRLEVPLCRGDKSLLWLKGQLQGERNVEKKSMSVYFSSRSSSAPDTEGSMAAEQAFCGEQSVAGFGTAWLWKGERGSSLDQNTMKAIRRMTADGCNKIRAFGGAKFDPGSKCDPEWEPFGSFCFFIPRIEYKESRNGNVLACTIAWDTAWEGSDQHQGVETIGFDQKCEAVEDAIAQLRALRPASLEHASSVCLLSPCTTYQHTPNQWEWHGLLDTVQKKFKDSVDRPEEDIGADAMSVSPMVALDEYLRNGQKGLDELLAASKPSDASGCDSSSVVDGEQLIKLVLARKTDLVVEENVDCCDLLGAVQEKDPKAYQFMLRLPTGQCFLGCSPERLYARTGSNVVSEAVAGTRGRGTGGDVEEDFWLAFDLLQSQKDGLEFQLVRESILSIFGTLCSCVNLEVEKSVLKQGIVQHLYSRIAGILRPNVSDLDLITELHPTPAVCGQPDDGALCLLREFEMFDRGFYAGPFGWFGGDSADIAVAIRSSLVGPPVQKCTPITLFAGVGIVPGSLTQSEWNELDLKIRQFTSLFQRASNQLIKTSSNCNALVAQSMVDELCRLGHNTFCIAPGSRSSPLTLAAARHPRAKLIPGIDERSLGYWALGHAKARNKPCVIITSSGTAVANLLPAVVEASQSNTPLIILSADRPSELRDTGSNQTIDQVGIFGKYVRWEMDLQAPGEEVLVRQFLTAIDNAVRYATSSSDPGPVHLNCQFRDPLNPKVVPWGDRLLDGLDQWLQSSTPFSAAGSGFLETNFHSTSPELEDIILNPKGILVLGEMKTPCDIAASIRLATLLGWPVFADLLAGVRIGSASVPGGEFKLINHFDQMLLSREHWEQMKPCSILHLGGRLTSKRLSEFLAWAVLEEQTKAPTKYMLVRQERTRYDPFHIVKYRLDCSVECLVEAAAKIISETGTQVDSLCRDAFAKQFVELDSVVSNSIEQAAQDHTCMTEVHVAKVLSECLPFGHGLFIGNSMPIRDLDMFGGPRKALASKEHLGAPIASNRGASGIDGVLSTAAGFADGLGRKCTLVVGDVSFLHDVNGLNLLRTGSQSPPLTVVLVNNNGGGIFNFLPISGDVPEEQFRPFWTTPQHVDIAGLCRAQGIPHSKVNTLEDLERSLLSSWQLNRHCILEVVTNIRTNVKHHDTIKDQIAEIINGYYDKQGIILDMQFERFSIPLSSPLTTQSGQTCHREGIYIYLNVLFSDGSIRQGVGEVSPLDGLHAENVTQALDQCKAIRNDLVGSEFAESYNPMDLILRISGLSNIVEAGGSLYPSVSFGLDAALWNAIASHEQIDTKEKEPMKVSALINPFNKSHMEINDDIKMILDKGYSCIKIKVGRSESHVEDAEIVKVIRAQVGPHVTLRVDANQAWSVEKATEFCNLVSSCNIEYLEEPLSQPELLYKFNPSMPVALDESIDQGVFVLEQGIELPDCIKYIILKPSLLGGLSETVRLSKAGEQIGVIPVISSSFESSLGLLHLSQIACLIDPHAFRYHGISTESWFQEKMAQVSCKAELKGRVVPSKAHATYTKAMSLQSTNDQVMIQQFRYSVSTSRVTWSIQQLRCNFFPEGALMRKLKGPIILLHGMFGSSSEMSDLAKRMSEKTSRPIVLIDLPGHGDTHWKSPDQLMEEARVHPAFQLMEVMAEQLAELLKLLGNGCTLVGYSLGARLALLTSIRYPDNIQNIVSISGGLGISDTDARTSRRQADKLIAEKLRKEGCTIDFLKGWYQADLWESLRDKPWFESYLEEKVLQLRNSRDILSFTLAECSPGKAPCIQDLLRQGSPSMDVLLVVGSLDLKYASMLSSFKASCENGNVSFKVIQGSGHAIHLENPQALTELDSLINL